MEIILSKYGIEGIEKPDSSKKADRVLNSIGVYIGDGIEVLKKVVPKEVLNRELIGYTNIKIAIDRPNGYTITLVDLRKGRSLRIELVQGKVRLLSNKLSKIESNKYLSYNINEYSRVSKGKDEVNKGKILEQLYIGEELRLYIEIQENIAKEISRSRRVYGELSLKEGGLVKYLKGIQDNQGLSGLGTILDHLISLKGYKSYAMVTVKVYINSVNGRLYEEIKLVDIRQRKASELIIKYNKEKDIESIIETDELCISREEEIESYNYTQMCLEGYIQKEYIAKGKKIDEYTISRLSKRGYALNNELTKKVIDKYKILEVSISKKVGNKGETTKVLEGIEVPSYIKRYYMRGVIGDVVSILDDITNGVVKYEDGVRDLRRVIKILKEHEVKNLLRGYKEEGIGGVTRELGYLWIFEGIENLSKRLNSIRDYKVTSKGDSERVQVYRKDGKTLVVEIQYKDDEGLVYTYYKDEEDVKKGYKGLFKGIRMVSKGYNNTEELGYILKGILDEIYSQHIGNIGLELGSLLRGIKVSSELYDKYSEDYEIYTGYVGELGDKLEELYKIPNTEYIKIINDSKVGGVEISKALEKRSRVYKDKKVNEMGESLLRDIQENFGINNLKNIVVGVIGTKVAINVRGEGEVVYEILQTNEGYKLIQKDINKGTRGLKFFGKYTSD